MRILLSSLAAALIAAPAMATKPTPEVLYGGPSETAAETSATQKVFVEDNTYRFAQPYRSERGTTAEACAYVCSSDRNCAAWSLTPATFQLGPRCELKQTPGTASHRPGAVSGMSTTWQMSPERDSVMRYQVAIPESRQPAAVPLEQLRPSPVPRVFGTPLPKTEPELLGGRAPRISAVMVPTEAPAPAIEFAAPQVVPAAIPEAIAEAPALPAPVELAEPAAPAPTPKPENLTQVASAPEPMVAPIAVTAEAEVETRAPTAFRDPALSLAETPIEEPEETILVDAVTRRSPPQAAPAPLPAEAPLVNAALKRVSETPIAVTVNDMTAPMLPPAQVSEVAPAPTPDPVEPLQMRLPWTERESAAPDYSVGGSTYVPGDEDATAGLSEAGS